MLLVIALELRDVSFTLLLLLLREHHFPAYLLLLGLELGDLLPERVDLLLQRAPALARLSHLCLQFGALPAHLLQLLVELACLGLFGAQCSLRALPLTHLRPQPRLEVLVGAVEPFHQDGRLVLVLGELLC